MTLPESFCRRMQALLGDGYAAFLASYDKAPQKGLRVNLCKCTVAQFLSGTSLPLRRIEFVPEGFYLDCTETGTGNLPEHHAGMLYLQEPAAMLPVAAAGIRAGDHVLDVCAAPGGKSTQIAACIGTEGVLCANEFVPSRAKILLSNIERLGVPNAIVLNTDAAHLRAWYEGCFDVVLVDAPCSGEGMFRKNPLAISEWSEEAVRRCAVRSYEILENAAECLRAGGTLVYSTCTFSPEENEWLIARFLETHAEYSVQKLSDAICAVTVPGITVPQCREDLTRCARCYPHITGGEGQFVCVLHKDGHAARRPVRNVLQPLKKQEQATVSACFSDLFLDGHAPLVQTIGGILYAVPPQMAVAGSCFSCGVRVGDIKNDRLVPHHQLFSAYGTHMRRTWDFSRSDVRIKQYLHGDAITLTAEESRQLPDGFGCVLLEGCALGGAKKVGTMLKNHYPKGLRTPKIN